ncbi:hypothetical protein [Clostridium botulinum]|uniref:hypothetical protein n=1 Tax=Clostridium botulinum TaxID=1491 RepID=UPI0004DA230F|nr:hypothetical protein [Clostridium botulinum]KEH99971.1 hypothetical protein Z952_14720 [Clostridium botulinum C/D str. BKT75002]KEI05693.1 hypothetical protein Z954_14900 [Clostridium botulinum C/D str. BKT2873]MCD3351767.1 hypothetical protein [Clostridium botulinum D/C]MCD3360693.1 hypothetical protein [Clostridium botulinum D/C]MCD3362119.1 hypothetical protein [Clostridium botulinum D/C]
MSEFFYVTLDKDVVIDDNKISRSTTWSSEQIMEQILNYTNSSQIGGDSGLKYMEINDVVSIAAGGTINKDYDLGENSFIITTLYLDIEDGSTFQFKIFDKSTNGFLLYDTDVVSHYTDSVFIPYKDKDKKEAKENKLHTQIINQNKNSSVTLKFKILGLEINSNK